MKTLAIGNETEQVCYAYFEGENLIEYGKLQTEHLDVLYETISAFAKDKGLSYIVVHGVDFENTKRRTALKLIRIRTIIKLICEQLGIVYATPSVHGWEKYLFGDRIQCKKLALEKIEIVNRVYNIVTPGLQYDSNDYQRNDLGVADAIVMGSAFTTNRYKKSVEGYYGL